MTETVRPYGKRVLVKLVDAETVTESGLIIPETAQEKQMRGLVLAAGSGGENEDGEFEPLDVRVGETVVFDKYAGTEIEVDGETRLIIDEEEILAVEE